MADTTHSDVVELKAWRRDVVDPAIEKVDTLWDDRNFVRGSIWVLLALSGGTFTLIGGVLVWAFNHISFVVTGH